MRPIAGNLGWILRMGALAFVVGMPLTLLGQECSDELPAVAKPKMRSCSWIDLVCKADNQRAEEHWRDLTRTFSDKYAIDGPAKDDPQNVEYKVRGCRGTVVAPEVSPTTLNTMHLSVLAPSGIEIFQQDFQNEGRPEMGRSIRLPETGSYTVRVSTTAPSKAVEVCKKSKGKSGWRNLLSSECIEKGTDYVRPTAYSIAFRGSSSAAALLAGDRADGSLTSQQPFARRINMDRRVAGQVSVKSMSGTPVAASLEREDGSLVGQETGTSLSFAIPPSPREAIYLLNITLNAGTQPTALTVSIDTGTAAARRLPVGQETVAEFQGLPADLTARSGAATHAEWTFSVSRPSPARLTVVPSGLAGLVVSVAVYNKTTEELVASAKRVERSTTLQLPLHRAGDYLVVLTPVQVASGHSSAKYTLVLDQ